MQKNVPKNKIELTIAADRVELNRVLSRNVRVTADNPSMKNTITSAS